jgi:hypothetical protein
MTSSEEAGSSFLFPIFLCGVSLYFIYTTVVRTVHTLVVISER